VTDPLPEHPVRLILLAEPGLLRAGLARFLAAEPGFEVTGECSSPDEALIVIERSPVDVVVFDFDGGAGEADDFIAAARQSGYRGRFLIVTGTLDAGRFAPVLKLGASGIFLKSESPDRLAGAIRLVARGEAWVDQRVIQLIADRLTERDPLIGEPVFDQHLNERERNVLSGVLEGFSNKQIGDHSGLSESSVKNVLRRLFRKTGVKSRSQLVRAAHGLVASNASEPAAASHMKSRNSRQPPESNM
jgi:two-component system, NarL family, nitrate/nitrite response regulator NarL